MMRCTLYHVILVYLILLRLPAYQVQAVDEAYDISSTGRWLQAGRRVGVDRNTAIYSQTPCLHDYTRTPDATFTLQPAPRPPLHVSLTPMLWRGKANASYFDGSPFFIGNSSWRCHTVLRYKIYNNTLYRATNFADRVHHHAFPAVEQMIMLALAKYRLPDMDFIFSSADIQQCELNFPVLTFGIAEGVGNGITIPTWPDWQYLAMSATQLRDLQQCLKGNLKEKQPVAFWRGAPTGYYHIEALVRDPTLSLLAQQTNTEKWFSSSRVNAVLSSLPYPWLDIKLSTIPKDVLRSLLNIPAEDGPATACGAACHSLRQLLVRKGLPVHLWNKFVLSVLFDGNGPAYREGLQLLGSSVLLKHQGNIKGWRSDHYVYGKHMEGFGGHAEFIKKSWDLLQEWKANSTRLLQMVQDMNELAFTLHTVDNMVKSMAWALLKVHNATGWQPKLTSDFEVLRFQASDFTAVSSNVQQELVARFPLNFQLTK